MKKHIEYTLKIVTLLSITFLISCSGFLKEYSQDLVVPKTPTDLDELLVGGADGYLPSVEVNENNPNIIGSWFNVLDDDVNGVIAKNSPRLWLTMQNFYFGYTTWQFEVGRTLKGYNHSDSQLWDNLYHRINSMNMILEQMKKIVVTTEKDRLIAKRVEGECYFLRAQFYLILTNIYGKAYSPATSDVDLAVPLKLTHYVEYYKDKDVQFERATVKEVYNQIVEDLKKSTILLTESPQLRPQFRASKEAAELLLSRVYLYMQRWNDAYITAKEVLKSKNELLDYKLVQSKNVVMTETNPEILFSQGSFALQNGMAANGGDFCVSKNLYSIYSDNDLRKNIFFLKNGLTDSIALSRKYKMSIHRSKVSDAFTLRVSEAYLNAAEAAAMLDQNSDATELIEKFTQKRYIDNDSIPNENEQLVEYIRNERRRELCFEGHRWFDLRRYAVSEKYPIKKEIVRYFPIYDNENRALYMNTRIYKLEIDDLAYTFQLPKSQLDMEPKQIANERKVKTFELYEENKPTTD